MENQVIISDYSQMDRALKEERTYILDICKQIKKAGCNVLLIQKSILRLINLIFLFNEFLYTIALVLIDWLTAGGRQTRKLWVMGSSSSSIQLALFFSGDV